MGTIQNGKKWLGAKINGNTVNGISKNGSVIFRKESSEIRYIRDYCGGSNLNNYACWTEIIALDFSGNNVCVGKTVSSSSAMVGILEKIIDGIVSDFAYPSSTGLHYVTIDLGSLFNIEKIILYHIEGRTFNSVKTQVSQDGINWITVFDSDVSGTYFETNLGKEILI